MNIIKMDKDSQIREYLNNMLKEIMPVVSAECGSLFLFDSENKELVLDAFFNSDNLYLKGLRQRVGEGVSGKVVELKEPVLVRNIDMDARFKRNGFKHYRTNSFISIPLFGSDGILGLMNLADKSSGEPFSEKDLEFAVTLSRYACAALEDNKQKSLLEKYASVGKLAAGVVHEINNPLDGIIRYTNILLSQLEDNSLARNYLLEIKKGLNRIANITKSLLEFSHQINSQSREIKKYVDIHQLIDDSLDMLNGKINRNIDVHKQYKDNLPKILDLGLQHIVINIIKNALDSMPDGGKLEISTNMNDSTIEVSFKDTGFGITNDIIEHIFEPFFTTKCIDKGVGLGLAMCKEIVNKYEGKIKVDSSFGKGSIFTVLIAKKYLENAHF